MARIGKHSSRAKRSNSNTAGEPIKDEFPVGSVIVEDAGESNNDDRESESDDLGTVEDNDGSVSKFIDPETVSGTGSGTGSDSGSETGKRRGRPRGSKNGKQKRTATEAQKTVATLLFSTHQMLAMHLKVEELALDETEAEKLATCINDVASHYDTPLLDEKTWAWLHLGFAAATIYGPRIIVITGKKNQPKKPIQLASPLAPFEVGSVQK